MIIYPLIVPGVIIVMAGIVIRLLQVWKGWVTHRVWHKHLPKFIISTGLMLPIGAHVWLDGIALFLVWLVFDVIKHHRQIN